MENFYAVSANDSRLFGKTDSETIQNAVNEAEKSGICEVVIPRLNARTGKPIWDIDKAILLPSEMTVIINNAHLRMVDGTFDNMFRNSNLGTPAGKTLEGEQHNINILGIGHALLDGGELNGLTEQVEREDVDNKWPPITVNLTIYFSNVRNFKIDGLEFNNTRWWATCFNFCRFGTISNLNFKNHATMENQDGIDLRCGCEYITIENITGITGDDTIALTGLKKSGFARSLAVEGKTFDIHDITIKNVISSAHGCAVIRFLNEDGCNEYNITVDGLKDTGRSICGAAIFIGMSSSIYVKDNHRKMGEFKNITIRNVTTCATWALRIAEPCENLTIENVATYGRCETGLYFLRNFEAKNVVINNFYFNSELDCADSFIAGAEGIDPEKFADLKITRARVASKCKYLFRKVKPEIVDFKYEQPEIAEYTEEKATYKTPYGRYFKYSLGEEIKNRPDDNRFTSTTKEDNL